MENSDNNRNFINANPALKALWAELNLPIQALDRVTLTGALPTLPSSFAVSTTAQASIAAAAGMASVIADRRGNHDLSVTIDSMNAALECTAYFKINGINPPQFAPVSGLYHSNDGYIRLHANFDHHRDIALRTLGLPIGSATSKEQAAAKIATWNTQPLDDAITQSGGACAALRTPDQWDIHPQAKALRKLPLIEIKKIGDAAPRIWSPISSDNQPLSGIRVLDLTRILAGPVCGRTLSAYGAEVMLVNSPNLPNIASIADTSRGKLSAQLDLLTNDGRNALDKLAASSHVFIQGYRPGALDKLGFGVAELAAKNPGIVCTSLSAYGRTGPWKERRGYDSLVQTATGFNDAEATAFGLSTPKHLPVQILDFATGFLMAFGTQAALYKQSIEGGSYHVQLSLARTGQWLREMGQSGNYLSLDLPNPEKHLASYDSGYGTLEAIPHAAEFSAINQQQALPSVPPGTNPPLWP